MLQYEYMSDIQPLSKATFAGSLVHNAEPT